MQLLCDIALGVDNWALLHTELVAACPDFNRSSDACRKKWKKIYDDYKADYNINGVSGNGRASKCKWYSLVDSYMHERANVMKHVHGSATDEDPNISQVDGVDTGGVNGDRVQNNGNEKSPPCISKLVGKRGEKLATQEAIQELSQQSKLLLETLKDTEKQKLLLLEGMLATMGQLVNKF